MVVALYAFAQPRDAPGTKAKPSIVRRSVICHNAAAHNSAGKVDSEAVAQVPVNRAAKVDIQRQLAGCQLMRARQSSGEAGPGCDATAGRQRNLIAFKHDQVSGAFLWRRARGCSGEDL